MTDSDIRRGAWRQPVNTSADEKGGIHDDDTAQQLGFEGGTIAGSIHMEQFTPLLLEEFGDRWWREGGVSLYFKAATQHRQPVRCLLRCERDTRARIWMEDEQEQTVMTGTAGLGDDPDSEVKRRVGEARPATDIRMFADVEVGRLSDPVPVRIEAGIVDVRLQVITEPLDCYTDARIMGGRVLPAVSLVHALRAAEPQIAPIKGPFVGLFGAIELQYLQGPAFAEREYEVVGEALALSESPKTEIIWHRHTLYDKASGDAVVRHDQNG